MNMEEGETNFDDVEVIESESLKFGKERDGIRVRPRKKKVSSMAGFVVRLSRGYIKTEFQANLILIVVSVIFFAISFFLFF